jgi:hypothetical protein
LTSLQADNPAASADPRTDGSRPEFSEAVA